MAVYCDDCGAAGSGNDEAGYTAGGGWKCSAHRPKDEDTAHPAAALRLDDERMSANREEYAAALLAAMERDGWPDANPANYCDISAAIRAGFPFSAAHLLTGATECRATDALIRERGGLLKGGDGWPIDWPEWSEWFRAHTVKCPKCGAFVFTDEGWPDVCGNDLAKLPPEPPTFIADDEDTPDGFRLLAGMRGEFDGFGYERAATGGGWIRGARVD
jgi:hypothetical protein